MKHSQLLNSCGIRSARLTNTVTVSTSQASSRIMPAVTLAAVKFAKATCEALPRVAQNVAACAGVIGAARAPAQVPARTQASERTRAHGPPRHASGADGRPPVCPSPGEHCRNPCASRMPSDRRCQLVERPRHTHASPRNLPKNVRGQVSPICGRSRAPGHSYSSEEVGRL